MARYFQEFWWTCISNQNSSVSWLQSLEFPAVTFCNFNAMKNFTIQSGDKKLTDIVHQLQAQSKALIRLGNFKAERVRDRSQSFVREISSAFDSTQDWKVRIKNLRTVSYLQIRQKCRVTILPKQYLKAATQKTSSEDLDTRYQRGKEMSVFLAKEDLQILTLLGHQFSDMVLSCTFRGMSCRWGTLSTFNG